MKKLLLFLNLCFVALSFSQTKTKYDCSFSHEDERGRNFTLTTEDSGRFKIDYYNGEGILVKTEHKITKKNTSSKYLDGLQIIYNYDGSIFSKGYFSRGKSDSLWEVNLRNGDKQFKNFKSGILLSSILINQKKDTIEVVEYRRYKKKSEEVYKQQFYDSGNLKKTLWKNYRGKDSIAYLYNKGRIEIIDYKDSFNTSLDSLETSKLDSFFRRSEIMPKFKGDENAFSDYISVRLVYPQNAADNDICGTVKIMFVVNIDGSVTDVNCSKSMPLQHPGLEKEAIRLITNSSGKWIPGEQNGKKVKVLCIVPIEFAIE